MTVNKNDQEQSSNDTAPGGAKAMNNKSPQELKPSISGGLDELVMLELRDVAHKAQIDYVAVNHPNGIRSGEDPELLGEFLKVNHERILAAITSHMQAGFEYVIGQDIKESKYVLNMGVPHNPPSNTTRTNLFRQGANLEKKNQRQRAAEWLLGSKENEQTEPPR